MGRQDWWWSSVKSAGFVAALWLIDCVLVDLAQNLVDLDLQERANRKARPAGG